MIEIDNLSKTYSRQTVLKNVSLNFGKPGIYSILGPNGSGKTTLIKSILNIVHKDKGSINVDGMSTDKNRNYRKSLTYQPQIARFPENLTIEQVIALIEDIRGEKANYEELIELFELQSHRKKNIRYLSGGSRQKFNILLALMFDTPLIIFDEPTTGLDPLSVQKYKRLLNELKANGRYIIMTSHDIHFVESVTDFIVFLLEGEVRYSGTVPGIVELTGGSNLEDSIALLLEK